MTPQQPPPQGTREHSSSSGVRLRTSTGHLPHQMPSRGWEAVGQPQASSPHHTPQPAAAYYALPLIARSAASRARRKGISLLGTTSSFFLGYYPTVPPPGCGEASDSFPPRINRGLNPRSSFDFLTTSGETPKQGLAASTHPCGLGIGGFTGLGDGSTTFWGQWAERG